jgi:DNA/RNA-binding domain of Phe-tRNA-synthetase-like protein
VSDERPDPAGRELELTAAEGFVDPDVAEELPGLRLDWLTVVGRDRDSPPEIVRRLGDLSNRYRGPTVVAMRTKPIPSAYRTFFRQIGLDPDTTRIPSEEAALGRLFHGQFRPSRRLIDDALLIALVETGIPIWALDADRVAAGGLGIRTAREGERLGAGEYARYLPAGTLVVVDADSVHSILFGERAPDAGVTRETRRVLLYAVSVAGVPAIHVEEGFWLAVEAIAGGGPPSPT